MSKTQTRSSNSVLDTAFYRECEHILGVFQISLAGLVETTVGLSGRATDLQRFMGVDAALAWGVWRTARAPSAIEAGKFVPGPASMNRFFRAAAKRGVAAEVVDRAASCHEDFLSLVERHADDRAVFVAMLSDISGGSEARAAYEKQKRAAFRALRFLHGHQTDTMFGCLMLAPGNGDDIAAGVLIGDVGVRYFRPGMPRLRQCFVGTTDLAPDSRIEPLSGSQHDVPLLMQEFSSARGVSFSRDHSNPAVTAIDIAVEQPGKSGAVSYMFGWIDHVHFPRGRVDPEPINISFHSSVPVQANIQDIIVADGVWQRGEPIMKTYARRSLIGNKFHYRDEELLPVQDHVRLLGRGLAVASTPSIPHYAEALAKLAPRLGVDPKACDVYRAKVTYPILNAISRISFGCPNPAPQIADQS